MCLSKIHRTCWQGTGFPDQSLLANKKRNAIAKLQSPDNSLAFSKSICLHIWTVRNNWETQQEILAGRCVICISAASVPFSWNTGYHPQRLIHHMTGDGFPHCLCCDPKSKTQRNINPKEAINQNRRTSYNYCQLPVLFLLMQLNQSRYTEMPEVNPKTRLCLWNC